MLIKICDTKDTYMGPAQRLLGFHHPVNPVSPLVLPPVASFLLFLALLLPGESWV